MIEPLDLMLLSPLVGALLLGVLGHSSKAGWINIAVCALTFVATLLLAINVLEHGPELRHNRMFYIDAFNVYLLVLTAFVGMTTAIFSRPYMQHELERGRLNNRRMQLYHAMYQGFLFAMLLCLSTNNLGLLWVSMEGATLATVLLVSLYRTPESVEAAWKYFILCGVGIAQALFGTVLLFFAAERVVASRDDALLWNVLHDNAHNMDPTVLALAFVFLLVGYGTKVGLGIAFAGLFRHLQPMVYGDIPPGQVAVRANMLPVAIHLALVLWLGLAIPGFLAHWFDQATKLISGSSLL